MSDGLAREAAFLADVTSRAEELALRGAARWLERHGGSPLDLVDVVPVLKRRIAAAVESASAGALEELRSRGGEAGIAVASIYFNADLLCFGMDCAREAREART